MSGNQAPEIMLILTIKYCAAERWGDAVILLDRLARRINNKEAIEAIKKIDPIIYVGGNIIPYLPEADTIMIYRDGSYEKVKREDLITSFVEAKQTVADVLIMMLEEVDISDFPAFISSLKSGGT
jgi:hypothetical protein